MEDSFQHQLCFQDTRTLIGCSQHVYQMPTRSPPLFVVLDARIFWVEKNKVSIVPPDIAEYITHNSEIAELLIVFLHFAPVSSLKGVTNIFQKETIPFVTELIKMIDERKGMSNL